MRGGESWTGREKMREAMQVALRDGPFGLKELAEEVGLSYHTIRAYAYGKRVPDGPNARRLAAALERRGILLSKLTRDLHRLADELERADG